MEDTVNKDFVKEMLSNIVNEIVTDDNIYVSENFNLNDAVLNDKKIYKFINNALEDIISKRKDNGQKKSAINDELYEKLMKGEVIIWSDITGSVEEKEYEKFLKDIRENEQRSIEDIKKTIVKLILDNFGSKHEIINGYLISSTGKKSNLLPSSIENLEFYEAEDVYDYMGIEIDDRIKDLFVCNLTNVAKILPDTHNKKYVGILVSLTGKDLIGIKKVSLTEKKFVGELLISEDEIGE
jgi:hypothetical protein